jgi:large-conductance mechanosensitive channel
MKNWSLIIVAVLAMPSVALAQTENAPPPPSFLLNLIFTLLPILLIAAFIWFFFVRRMRKLWDTNSIRVEEQRRHNEVTEKLLDRIAKALEKRNGDTT